MNLTEKELESAQEFLGYIAKYNISKSDAIFLSEFYRNKKKKMNFSEGSEYEQNQIVPVFKKYGISFIKRASVTIAIKKCIHLTDSNFPSEQLPSSWQELNKTENIKIEKVKQKKEEPKAVLQNKQEKPTVATADKVNKTSEATKPTRPKKPNTLGFLFALMIIGALVYFVIGLFGGSSDEISSNEFDFIKYRAQDVSFSEAYGEPVYTIIDFGNKIDKYAVMAILGDERGVNVFGKLFGGMAGLNTIIDGTYSIQGSYVIINWDKNNILDLPTKLKIENDTFNNKRLNASIKKLIDESNNINYIQQKAWNAK